MEDTKKTLCYAPGCNTVMEIDREGWWLRSPTEKVMPIEKDGVLFCTQECLDLYLKKKVEAEAPKYAPCPFPSCGNTTIEGNEGLSMKLFKPELVGATPGDQYCVICKKCHTEGPIGATEEEAIEKWNTGRQKTKPSVCPACHREVASDSVLCKGCRKPVHSLCANSEGVCLRCWIHSLNKEVRILCDGCKNMIWRTYTSAEKKKDPAGHCRVMPALKIGDLCNTIECCGYDPIGE